MKVHKVKEKGLLLGIDIGGGGIKIAAFDTEGHLIEMAMEPIDLSITSAGCAEYWPYDWVKKIECCMKRIKETINDTEILSIGLSNMCPSLVAMNKSGDPIRPAILYLDTRSWREALNIQKLKPIESFMLESGNRVAAGTISGTSMRWLKDNEPDNYCSTEVFGHANTYIAKVLTGNFGMDYSNASLTGLFDQVNTMNWSTALCEVYGVDIKKLPELKPSYQVIGHLSKQGSQIMGLREDVPVVMGGADSACSAFAAGAIEEGDVFETAGTSNVLAVCSAKPSLESRFLNRNHVVPQRWLGMGAMVAVGAAFRWVRDVLGFTENYVAGLSGLDVYNMLCEEAACSQPGAGGVIFLPYMSGERSPIWDPNARGVFFGLNLKTTKNDLIRAVLEGGIYGLKANLEIAEVLLKREVNSLTVVGKGSNNHFLNQLKADITCKELRVLKFNETAVMGAALLGGVAVGVYKDCGDAVRAIVKEHKTYLPDYQNEDIYRSFYNLYKNLYPSLKDHFRELKETTTMYY
jgi:xylulokinase